MIMRMSKVRFQTIIMAVLCLFVKIQVAHASAKVGEATVYEDRTVTVNLPDPYKRTLMQSTGVTYQWYSESNSYATVTSSTRYSATIKGVRATSSCKVYFKCSYFIDGFYRTMDFYYDITVKATTISVTNVSLSRSSATMKEGNTLQLTATVYPLNATNKQVYWSSSNTSVATVSSSGLVSAKSEGTATITCRAADGSGKYATCRITVESSMVYISSIALNENEKTLYAGETLQLRADITPSTATNKSLDWSSDNAAVATVSSNGLVTAKSAGNATIICKAKDGSGKSAACSIVVKEIVKPVSISLNRTKAVLKEGETLQLIATVTPEDATDKSLTWISDNREVATVDNHGFVTAQRKGTANIIVMTANDLAAVCAITVESEATGETLEWQGSYHVSASHVENNPTQTYPDEFDLVIRKNEGAFYITSMFGCDLTQYNNGGLKLKDQGDGTATVDISEYNILNYTDNSNPLYTLYVFDEATDDWSDTWTLKMNDDGSLLLGDFYIAAFLWSEENQKWQDGELEALYYKVTAEKKNLTGITGQPVEMPALYSTPGALILDRISDIAVYRDNGVLVYKGKTNQVNHLSKGLYIVRIGSQSRKVLVK